MKDEGSRIRPGRPNGDGSVPLHLPDDVVIGNPTPVAEPSLANPMFDPFSEFKTDEENFHYRALNTRKQNMAVRKAEGYETIPDAEFGDLVLGKIPREVHERRVTRDELKNKHAVQSAKESFKEKAKELGVKTFED